MPLIDAFYKGDINYFINTHEQSAGHAATAYARVSGKPGISIVTSGPGLTNSVTPLTDATNDSTPFILFSGQVPLSAIGTNAFQECPSVDITKPVTKWSYCIKNTEEIPDVIDEAFRVALTGKQGSVHIDLPKCLTLNKYDKNLLKNNLDSKIYIENKNINTKLKVFDINKIHKISDLINNSKKPVIIAGQGCFDCISELRLLSKISNIPVTTTIHGMGVFDEMHLYPLNF